MAKLALLIGVSEYGLGLNPLAAATKDVLAMQQVLQHPEVGSFDEVIPLINPDRQAMEEAIYNLFANRHRDDLLLLFFSGHGVKDESGNLYLATRITRKEQGRLVQPTAVAASFVHKTMSSSKSKREALILDCCFSGAFAEGMKAKDDGSVPIKQQLGGEGRAVLTSSTSTQYSFEEQGAELSTYTRYLVEGIETGVADTDNDGAISVDELHEYAKKKVQEAAPAMQPEIYPIKEGHKILLAKAAIGDPKLKYRREVERFAKRGEISAIGRTTLDLLQNKLRLLPNDAAAIEAEILEPYQEYRRRLDVYKQHFANAIEQENPLSLNTRKDLEELQEALGLRNEDIEPIRAEVVQKVQKPVYSQLIQPVIPAIPSSLNPNSPNNSRTISPSRPRNSNLLIGACITAVAVGSIGGYVYFNNQSDRTSVLRSPAQQTSASSSCIVTTVELNVRSEPNGKLLDKLKVGDKPSTTGKKQGDWIEISAPVKGWISQNYTQPCSLSKGRIDSAQKAPQTVPSPLTTVQKAPQIAPIPIPSTPNQSTSQTVPISTLSTPIDIVPSPSSSRPFGAATKSWCLGQKDQWQFRKDKFGRDDQSIKASMEEADCGYWGITVP